MKVQTKVKIVNKSTNPLPQYKTDGAVGLDLSAFISIPVIIEKGKTKLIETGLYIEIPYGYEGQVRPRSGLALSYGVTVLNSPGTIDSDYRGEIKIMLHNTSNMDFIVSNGDRIAQLVICPVIQVELEVVNELSSTDRGSSGFGSTGGYEEMDDDDDEYIQDYDYNDEYYEEELEELSPEDYDLIVENDYEKQKSF